MRSGSQVAGKGRAADLCRTAEAVVRNTPGLSVTLSALERRISPQSAPDFDCVTR